MTALNHKPARREEVKMKMVALISLKQVV